MGKGGAGDCPQTYVHTLQNGHSVRGRETCVITPPLALASLFADRTMTTVWPLGRLGILLHACLLSCGNGSSALKLPLQKQTVRPSVRRLCMQKKRQCALDATLSFYGRIPLLSQTTQQSGSVNFKILASRNPKVLPFFSPLTMCSGWCDLCLHCSHVTHVISSVVSSRPLPNYYKGFSS